MTWKRIATPIAGAFEIEEQLRTEVGKELMEATRLGLATEAIAVFVSSTVGESMIYYFAPGCGGWADQFIEKYAGGPCERPSGRWLTRIAGDHQSWSLLSDIHLPFRLR